MLTFGQAKWGVVPERLGMRAQGLTLNAQLQTSKLNPKSMYNHGPTLLNRAQHMRFLFEYSESVSLAPPRVRAGSKVDVPARRCP